MRSPEGLRPKLTPDPRFQVREVVVKQWEFNRFLYSLVGAGWNWTDKSRWSDDQWRAYAEADRLRTFVAYLEGSVAGYYELEQDEAQGVEIAIFGLTPKFIGRGFGGAMLTHALQEAWRMGPSRVWLHTCDLDHPGALANYQARGMIIYRVVTEPAR